MSLTIPNSYKRSNIHENWIILLGYNEAFDSSGSSNQLNEALDNSETAVDVDDGDDFVAGDYIKIDNEVMLVESVSTDTLTVKRSYGVSAVATHTNNTQIYFDNYTGIALSDTTVDNRFYPGVVTSTPSIRESIDIENSTASTGNVSITLANFQFKGDDFSAEIFNGSRAYVNRTCKIYSQPDHANDLADCLLIYIGRLTDFSHDHHSITLQLTTQRPWDDVEIPQTKTAKDNYFPIAYGNFTPNAASVSISTSSDDDDFRNRKTLYPIPLEERRGDTLYALTGEWSQTGNAFPHLYEKNIDKFSPLANHASTYSTVDAANETYGSGYAVLCHQNLLRKNLTKLKERTSSGTGWASNDNAFDDTTVDTSTYTQFTIDAEFGNGNTFDVKYKMPQLIGFASTLQFHYIISGTCTLGSTSGSGEIRVQVIDNTFSNAQILGYFRFVGAATVTTLKETNSGNLSISSAALASSTADRDTVFLASSSGWGEDFIVRMKHHLESGTLDGDLTGNLRLYDVMIETVSQLDFANTTNGSNKTGSYKILEDLDWLYCGGDGLTDNGWNSSAAITEIHEAHRDMMQRFTTFVDSTGTAYGSSNHPTNWSSGTNLNSIKDWGIRYWVNEPQPLIDCLEELQYNGGFIGRFNGQGNYQYVFIPDSISTDFTLTKEDLADVDISLTPFEKIVTSMDIQYEKHPVKGYVSEVNATNSSSITAYNVKSTENKKKIQLNALVSAPASSAASNPNDDWFTYYDNLLATVKHDVNATIVNPYYYGIDVGDFVRFDDIGVNPFGGAWTNRDFIITGLQRSPGKIKIKAREVS